MARKRRSLSSILVPSFLPQSSASSAALSPNESGARTPSASSEHNASEDASDWISFYSGYSGATSPRSELSSVGPVTPSRHSPPPDLLDEDPFANLSPAPSLRGSRATSPVRTVFDVFSEEPQPLQVPPSPLSQSASLERDGRRRLRSQRSLPSLRRPNTSASTPPPTHMDSFRPAPRRCHTSAGPPQVQPAYARPAFAPRPSLPSLNTLTRGSIHVPKVRIPRRRELLLMADCRGPELCAPRRSCRSRPCPMAPTSRTRLARGGCGAARRRAHGRALAGQTYSLRAM